MPSWLLAACLCGAALGGAVVAVHLVFAPTTPDLADTIARLRRTSRSARAAGPAAAGESPRTERFGAWVQRLTANLPGLAVPYADLDLIGMTPAGFHASKGVWAVIGLAAPAVITAWAWILGVSLGWETPVLLALLLAVGGWCVPHLLVRRRAAETRQRFARTITAYIDLVVLERLSGATLATAIIEPAGVADAPLFRRIRQALGRSQLERKPPWVALRELADDIALPDLQELADTMELSGAKGAPMAEQLKARASDIRNAWLHADVEAAGAASQRQVATTGLLLFCFLVFVGAPALLRLVAP